MIEVSISVNTVSNQLCLYILLVLSSEEVFCAPKGSIQTLTQLRVTNAMDGAILRLV